MNPACTNCGHPPQAHDETTNRCFFDPNSIYTNPNYVLKGGSYWIRGYYEIG